MVMGSNQPLTKISTRNLPVGKGRPARKADNLTAVYEPTVYTMWKPRRFTVLWVSTACYLDSFTFFHLFLLLVKCLRLMLSTSRPAT
jgi:hypothetical protein